MIRINLVNPGRTWKQPTAATPHEQRIVSRQEALLGAVLLAAAGGVLFYLASQPHPSESHQIQSLRAAASGQLAPEPPPLTIPVAAPVAADPPPPDSPAVSATGSCDVTEIKVDRTPSALSVFLAGGRQPKYESFELKEPPRIVVDLPGCKGRAASQEVGDPLVERVRTSQYKVEPPVFRVVLDLKSMPRYQINPRPDGLEIRILEGQS